MGRLWRAPARSRLQIHLLKLIFFFFLSKCSEGKLPMAALSKNYLVSAAGLMFPFGERALAATFNPYSLATVQSLILQQNLFSLL